MPDFAFEAPVLTVRDRDELTLERSANLRDDFVLSPFVWRVGSGYEVLIRVVNRDDDPLQKVARIFRATSADGLRFAMDDAPTISPGPDESDDGGCEDPTVVSSDSGYDVFYAGYSKESRTSTLLSASGGSMRTLVKRGPVLPRDDSYANAKEASLVRCAGGYRLFFEFSRNEASLIGCAAADSLRGPWHYVACAIEPRPQTWDAWHLSPGPIVTTATGTHLLFYNGATRDARWRIGWAELDSDLRRVLARCKDPIVVPPPASGDRTDIAFLASVVESQEDVWLYYSVGDRQLMRAVVRIDNR